MNLFCLRFGFAQETLHGQYFEVFTNEIFLLQQLLLVLEFCTVSCIASSKGKIFGLIT